MAQQRIKAYADKSRVDKAFCLGDKVLLSTKNLKLKNEERTVDRAKLLPKYVGPYEITELIGKVAYRLALPESTKIHPVLHVSLLYPYKDPEVFPGAIRQAVPLDWLEGDPTFEVEEISDHKILFSGGKRSVTYLIKWAGFSDIHDTWEPEKSLQKFVPEMVQEYTRTHRLPMEYDQTDPHCIRSGQPRKTEKSTKRRTFGAPPLPESVASQKQVPKPLGPREPNAWADDRETTSEKPKAAKAPKKRVQLAPETEPQENSEWFTATEDQARKSGRKRQLPVRFQTISYVSVLLEDRGTYSYIGKPVDLTLASIAAKTFSSTEGHMPSHLEEIYKRHFCTAATSGPRKRKRAIALAQAAKIPRTNHTSPGGGPSGLSTVDKNRMQRKRTMDSILAEQARQGHMQVSINLID